MTTIKGIVAGVGNKEKNENVITPQFDARIVDFMVGGSAIIEGFQLINRGINFKSINGTTESTPHLVTGGVGAVYYSTGYIGANIGKNATNIKLSQTVPNVTNTFTYFEDTGTIMCVIAGEYPNKEVKAELSWESPVAARVTKGMVVHKGYRGELLEDIENITETNVYATFILHNTPDLENTDVFQITTTNDTLLDEKVEGDTITYNLLLYSGGKKNPALHDIPAIVEHSLTCDTVLEGGVIDSNVIGVTQPLNDNSLRIATTQYVQNAIDEWVNYGTYEITLSNTDMNSDGNIKLQRKSKQVICEISTAFPTYFMPTTLKTYKETIPVGFRPKSNQSVFAGHYRGGSTGVGGGEINHYWIMLFVFGKDGSISAKRVASWEYGNTNYPNELSSVTVGWTIE